MKSHRATPYLSLKLKWTYFDLNIFANALKQWFTFCKGKKIILQQKAEHSISLQAAGNITAALMPFTIGCGTSVQLEARARNRTSFVHRWNNPGNRRRKIKTAGDRNMVLQCWPTPPVWHQDFCDVPVSQMMQLARHHIPQCAGSIS